MANTWVKHPTKTTLLFTLSAQSPMILKNPLLELYFYFRARGEFNEIIILSFGTTHNGNIFRPHILFNGNLNIYALSSDRCKRIHLNCARMQTGPLRTSSPQRIHKYWKRTAKYCCRYLHSIFFFAVVRSVCAYEHTSVRATTFDRWVKFVLGFYFQLRN